jgi:hypothetical protein
LANEDKLPGRDIPPPKAAPTIAASVVPPGTSSGFVLKDNEGDVSTVVSASAVSSSVAAAAVAVAVVLFLLLRNKIAALIQMPISKSVVWLKWADGSVPY